MMRRYLAWVKMATFFSGIMAPEPLLRLNRLPELLTMAR